jgi:hypothetical protein
MACSVLPQGAWPCPAVTDLNNPNHLQQKQQQQRPQHPAALAAAAAARAAVAPAIAAFPETADLHTSSCTGSGNLCSNRLQDSCPAGQQRVVQPAGFTSRVQGPSEPHGPAPSTPHSSRHRMGSCGTHRPDCCCQLGESITCHHHPNLTDRQSSCSITQAAPGMRFMVGKCGKSGTVFWVAARQRALSVGKA